MTNRILLSTSSFPFKLPRKKDIDTGGGGSFVYYLAKGISKYTEIVVLAPKHAKAPKYEESDNLKVYRHKQFITKHLSLAYESGIPANLRNNKLLYIVVPFYLFYQLCSVISLVKKHNINLIHSQWIIPQGLVAAIYKKLWHKKISLIITVHGSDYWKFQHGIGRILLRFILQSAERITVPSEAIKKGLLHINIDRPIDVIHMGVDTDKFHPGNKNILLNNIIDKRWPKILFVGSIIETKGIRQLLEAMPQVVDHFPDTQLIIIGEGNLKNEMIELAKDIKMEHNIIFTGPLANNELPHYYAIADIFTLPSQSEGYPLVVMEALSSGTVCIVSDIAIFKEIHKKTGLLQLVPAKNTHLLAEKIIQVLNRKESLYEVQRECRKYAEKELDWKTVINRFMTCYAKTLSS